MLHCDSSTLKCQKTQPVMTFIVAFSALTLLIGWQEEHLACKNWVVGCWHGHVCCEMQMIYIWSSWCQCHPIISCCSKIQNGLPFWYWFTQVVQEIRLLNECSSSSATTFIIMLGMLGTSYGLTCLTSGFPWWLLHEISIGFCQTMQNHLAVGIRVNYTTRNKKRMKHAIIIHQSLNMNRTKQNDTRMWANAQCDGRPAKYRWRPLFNAAKFRCTSTSAAQ